MLRDVTAGERSPGSESIVGDDQTPTNQSFSYNSSTGLIHVMYHALCLRMREAGATFRGLVTHRGIHKALHKACQCRPLHDAAGVGIDPRRPTQTAPGTSPPTRRAQEGLESSSGCSPHGPNWNVYGTKVTSAKLN